MSKYQSITKRILIPTMAVSTVALAVGAALAEPPPADTVIGNQAAATYTSNGEEVTVQSNLVETIVNEVFGLELSASQTLNGAPGGFTFFPHTLTNNGNTDDVFSLLIDETPAGDDFSLTDIAIFLDADQDGVPDNATPITLTPAILAGESLGLVVRATIPASASATESSDFVLTATSEGSTAPGETPQTASNTDTVDITTDGILTLNKDQSLLNDADGNGVISIGDTIEVNLEYTNTGIGDATNIVIEDILPSTNNDGDPITLTYVPGSGVWSDAPSTVLTDASGDVDAVNGSGVELDFSFAGPLTITAALDAVPAGRSGSIQFNYVVTAAPEGGIENIATVATSTQTQTPSNGSTVTVAPAAALTFADAAGLTATPASGTDGAGNLDTADLSANDADATLNDVVTNTDTVFAGGSINFDFVLSNLGNGLDTFSLSVPANSFPVGTRFDLVAADGATPLVGDEVTLAEGESVHVQLVATLPGDAPATVAPAGFAATLSAVSQTDPSTSNETTALFNGAVETASIDLANTSGGAPSTGIGTGNIDDAGDPFETLALNPGEEVSFPLQITVPAGSPANTFELSTGPLPEGWVATFIGPDGQPIQNTGALIPTDTTDATFNYSVVISVPEGAGPLEQPFEIIATSPTNGATDSLINAVSVNEIVDLELLSSATIQAAPGGVAVIAHTLTNLGNSDVTAGDINLGDTDPFTDEGFTAAIFFDANDNGILDAGDPVVTNISELTGPDGVAGLSPDETARIFVRVQVPSTAIFGIQETGDVSIGDTLTTATGSVTDQDLTNNSLLDTVTVISGDISFTKEQAVDENCDGTPETAFSQASQPADPGDCLVYQIRADNTGFTDATDVVIRDTTPAFTSIEDCSGNCTASFVLNGTAATLPVLPADEGTGLVATSSSASGVVLTPGQSAEVRFTVQIDE
ncbi:MAG: hypothetical protein ABJG15_10605 [Hyphomonadaceae bacterium]